MSWCIGIPPGRGADALGTEEGAERYARALILAVKAKIARKVADRIEVMADQAWDQGREAFHEHLMRTHARCEEIAWDASRESSRLGH